MKEEKKETLAFKGHPCDVSGAGFTWMSENGNGLA